MSDEIPVGSPPAPPGRHAAPGGWYADPVDPQRERYWDGWQWTRNVRPGRYAGSAPQQRTAPVTDPRYGPQDPVATGGATESPYGQPGMPMAPGYAYSVVPATADGVPLAGFGWRVAAYFVDYFLLYAVWQIIAMVTPLGAAVTKSQNEAMAYLTEVMTTGTQVDFTTLLNLMNSPEAMILNVISTVLFIVYSALFLKAKGATLGKLLFRLRVVPVGEGRTPPGLPNAKAWLRPAITEVIAFVPLLSAVDYLFPLWDRKKQTLHDKIARTQVVREERRELR
ncbi:MAG: RDD family protein [Propionibacteriaceae bacterium]|nr:RDD family protein [Propionibacteriaceae bacterium]